jgi:type VI secretion system secreted protein VgrG
MCEATIELPILFWTWKFKVPIYRGKTFTPPKPGRVHATPKAFAAILSELPSESLVQIKQVNLNPTPNPDDAVWAADPKYNPSGGDFVSHMSMGAAGIVQVYPASANADLKEIETTLLHETGHSISNRILGEKKTDKPWDKWRDAMQADGMNLSTYGKSSVSEDFAESWALWLPVRGTPAEAEVLALIPNRVKVMATIYDTGKPPP